MCSNKPSEDYKHAMLRFVPSLILATICLAQQGCSYETRSPQYSVALHVQGSDDAAVRAAVEEYAKSHGYARKMATSIEAELNIHGIILWSFHAPNRSFISLTNAIVVDCYDLGVYSIQDAAAARMVGQDILQTLGQGATSPRIDFSGSQCSRKK